MGARRKRRERQPAGEELEIDVERLVNGPGALGHAPDGRVVFLDDGLPGERVRVLVEGRHRGVLRARVVRRLDPPSPSRRIPPCPVVSLCGGCPWQALSYPAQVEAKVDVVLREVERAGGVRPEAIEAPVTGPEWGARHRVRLAVRRRAGVPPEIGYRARGSRDVVPVAACAIARPEVVAGFPLARALAEWEPSVREIEVSVDDRGTVRLCGKTHSTAVPPADVDAIHRRLLARAPIESNGLAYGGVVVEQGVPGGWRLEAGDVVQSIRVARDLEIGVPAGVFTQVNASLNEALVSEVVAAAAGSRCVLDLYCGAGNFSLPLAQSGATVLGIDQDERAIAAARASARALGLDDRASFIGRVADAGALAGLSVRPDVVLLDPPRGGAAEVLPAVLALRPRRIVYVSCDVATFARDAGAVVGAGWGFSSLRLVDLTPQTHRAEVLGVFELTWERGGPYREG